MGQDTTFSPLNRGSVRFEQLRVDLGAILDCDVTEIVFPFRNTSERPAEIVDINPTCNCTVASLRSMTLEPGEATELRVTFDPVGQNGPVQRDIVVSSPQIFEGSARLSIIAKVKPVVVVYPRVVQLGRVQKGAERSQRMTIAGRLEDFEVTRARFDGPDGIEVEIGAVRPSTIAGDDMWRQDITVSVSSGVPTGRLNGRLVLQTTEARRPVIEVPVVCEVRGDLAIQPPAMFLRNVTAGETFEHQVRVYSRTDVAFSVVGAELEHEIEGLAVEIEPEASGAGYLVRVGGTIGDETGVVQGDLVIRTDVDGEHEVRVPFYASVSAPRVGTNNAESGPGEP